MILKYFIKLALFVGHGGVFMSQWLGSSLVYTMTSLVYRPVCVYVCMYTTSRHSCNNYNDVTMSAMASQITSLTIVYSSIWSGAYQRKHQSSASLAFAKRIYRWPMNSPHKGPVTRKNVFIWWRHHVNDGFPNLIQYTGGQILNAMHMQKIRVLFLSKMFPEVSFVYLSPCWFRDELVNEE